MTLDHIAIWTPDIEKLKEFYVKFFNGRANEKYINHKTGFESYFVTFESGSRLEIMQLPGILENMNPVEKQHYGIIHLAFRLSDMQSVIEKSGEMEKAGFRILRGPRVTGDGYFEFETLDPDNNRIEVMTIFTEKK